MNIKNAILLVLTFSFLLFYSIANAVEPQCPGGSLPDPNIIFCDNFDNLNVGWTESDCCYHAGPGVNNGLPDGNGPQRGVNTDDPRAKPGGVDPGPCPIPPGNDCGLTPTTFVGDQGFVSHNAFWSGYYWESHGNYYGKVGIGGSYTELRIRFYVYLNNGWIIPCHPGIPIAVNNNCGAKLILLGSGGQYPGYLLLYSAADSGDGETMVDLYANPPGPEQIHQNISLLTLHANQWYLYEWHVKMNNGSNFDGTSELWIDEVTPGVPFTGPQTLRERHTNLRFTGANGTTATSWTNIGFFPNSNYGYCHQGMLDNTGANGAPACGTYNGIVVTTHPNAYYKVAEIVVSKGSTMIGPVDLQRVKAPVNVHAE